MNNFRCKYKNIFGIFLLTGTLHLSAMWQCDIPQSGVCVLRNENGVFGGYTTKGVLPIAGKNVIARKKIDLTKLPMETLRTATQANLQVYFCIMDGSLDKPGKPNGLQEEFIVSINGHRQEFSTSDKRFPAKTSNAVRRQSKWVDFSIPVKYLHEKKILDVQITKKGHGDDFIFPGIDHTVPTTSSSASFDGGKTWSSEWLDTGRKGEFMIRLAVGSRKQTTSTWRPGTSQNILSGFTVKHDKNTKSLKLELDQNSINFNEPVRLNAEVSGKLFQAWLHFSGGDAAEPFEICNNNGMVSGTLPLGRKPYAIDFSNFDRIKKITLSYTPQMHLNDNMVNMAPTISLPGGRRHFHPSFEKAGKRLTLDNGSLKAVFDISSGLSLKSVYIHEIESEILKYPEQNALFLLKLDNGRILNAKNGRIRHIATREHGFTVLLDYGADKIQGRFSADMEDDELKLSLSLMSKEGQKKVVTAFPHLDGIVLSSRSFSDYYCFPWGGGVIADRDAFLRTIYGDNEAWWQMISLFSPERGGGFYMRVTDTTGITKAFTLRKGVYASAEHTVRPPQVKGRNTTELLFSPSPLIPGNGIGMAVDYQKLTLHPGNAVHIPAVKLGGHAGNWKYPMKRYAKWAKSVWKFRPYPGKLTGNYNILAGFGCGKPLFNEDYGRLKKEPIDIAEINGYWTVSDKAPWNTPFDKIATLGARLMADYNRGFGFYPDPVTGKMVYMFNRGDYNGYNPQWGGLPRLQKLIKTIQRQNQILLLYTDPVIVSANSDYGKKYAAQYAVINPAWQDPHQCPKNPKEPAGVVCNYFSYCMCLNSPEYLEYVADSMVRLLKESGADGIRLDEYGHRGFVCLSRQHNHIFGEHGQHIWLQALKKSLQMIRKKTDEFNPNVLLLGEFPGADITAAEFDGALSYDICRRQSALRPVPVNLFRFYFPECKIFELNVSGPENAMDYWLFNGLGVYNSGRYKREYWEILKRHKDAFAGDIEPLVPTLKKHVYANRFTTNDGRKTVYTVINCNSIPVNGSIIPVTAEGKMSCREEISGKNLPLHPYRQSMAIAASLNPKEVKVIVVERQ